jgi:hypothetical protein
MITVSCPSLAFVPDRRIPYTAADTFCGPVARLTDSQKFGAVAGRTSLLAWICYPSSKLARAAALTVSIWQAQCLASSAEARRRPWPQSMPPLHDGPL